MSIKINAPGSTKADNVFLVPQNEITVDYSQNHSRFGKSDRTQLRESLRVDGQQVPILVRRIKPGNTLVVVAGYGRFEELAAINSELPSDQQRPILVQVIDGNESDGILANLRENVNTPMGYMDQAKAVKTLIDHFKYSDTQIAQHYGGPSKMGFVVQRKKLLTLSLELQEALHRDEMTLTAALDLAERPEAERNILYATAAAELAKTPEVPAVAEPATPVVEGKGKTAKKRRGNPTPKVPKPGKKRVSPKNLKAAEAKANVTPSKPQKRTGSEVKDFFEVMIGSPVMGKRSQEFAKFIIDLYNGVPGDDNEAVEVYQGLMGEREEEEAAGA